MERGAEGWEEKAVGKICRGIPYITCGKSATYLTCAHSFHWPDPWHKEDWGQRTLTCLSTLKYTQQLLRCNRQWNLQNTLGSSPCRIPQWHPPPLACSQRVRGNKKQEIVKELKFCYPYVPPAIGVRTSYLNQRSSGI